MKVLLFLSVMLLSTFLFFLTTPVTSLSVTVFMAFLIVTLLWLVSIVNNSEKRHEKAPKEVP